MFLSSLPKRSNLFSSLRHLLQMHLAFFVSLTGLLSELFWAPSLRFRFRILVFNRCWQFFCWPISAERWRTSSSWFFLLESSDWTLRKWPYFPGHRSPDLWWHQRRRSCKFSSHDPARHLRYASQLGLLRLCSTTRSCHSQRVLSNQATPATR